MIYAHGKEFFKPFPALQEFQRRRYLQHHCKDLFFYWGKTFQEFPEQVAIHRLAWHPNYEAEIVRRFSRPLFYCLDLRALHAYCCKVKNTRIVRKVVVLAERVGVKARNPASVPPASAPDKIFQVSPSFEAANIITAALASEGEPLDVSQAVHVDVGRHLFPLHALHMRVAGVAVATPEADVR